MCTLILLTSDIQYGDYIIVLESNEKSITINRMMYAIKKANDELWFNWL